MLYFPNWSNTNLEGHFRFMLFAGILHFSLFLRFYMLSSMDPSYTNQSGGSKIKIDLDSQSSKNAWLLRATWSSAARGCDWEELSWAWLGTMKVVTAVLVNGSEDSLSRLNNIESAINDIKSGPLRSLQVMNAFEHLVLAWIVEQVLVSFQSINLNYSLVGFC